jgi:hypothetical protein
MLTVDKLVKTMAYEENRKKKLQENNERTVFNLPAFKEVKTKEDLIIKREEIKAQKEKEMKERILKLYNQKLKRDEQLNKAKEKLQQDKHDKIMSLSIFSHIQNRNEWIREKHKIRREKMRYREEQEQKNKMKKERNMQLLQKSLNYKLNLQNTNTPEMSEVQKNILEYRKRLQEEHNKRMERQGRPDLINKFGN